MRFTKTRLCWLSLLAVAVLAAGVLAACGSNSSKGQGNGVDRAFAQDMAPHHASAIDMANIAKQRGQHPEIKTLAGNIVRSQSAEIKTLKSADKRLAGAGVKKGDLGLGQSMMGMSMHTTMLKTATPFDRAFVDMMIPHHQGAIRMARVELAKGQASELKHLAQQIIDAQAKEIGQMNTWRTSWYGTASPAGGVPTDMAGH